MKLHTWGLTIGTKKITLLGTNHFQMDYCSQQLDRIKEYIGTFDNIYTETDITTIDYNHDVFKMSKINGIPYCFYDSSKTPSTPNGLVLDELIKDVAGMKWKYSETVNAQLDGLLKMRIEDVKLLHMTDMEIELSFEKIKNHILHDDINCLMDYIKSNKEMKIPEQMVKSFLYDRNINFVEKIMNSKNSTIHCYGLLHFIGDDNILDMIRKTGIKVSYKEIVI